MTNQHSSQSRHQKQTTHDHEQTEPNSLSSIAYSFGPLGFTAFGGPVAHLAYFREEFVERKQWMSDKAYSAIVALSQFLPGPGSSQVGMAVGYHRGGITGLVLAWLLFTAPSAIILAAFGLFMGSSDFDAAASGWVKGLLAAAVAVVTHAVIGMATKFLNSIYAWVLAIATAAAIIFLPHPLTQIGAIAIAGLVGVVLHAVGKSTDSKDNGEPGLAEIRPVSKTMAYSCLVLFFILLLGLWLGANTIGGYVLTRAHAFYHAGALVFGGGHVVLPLLEEQTVTTGWMSQEQFLSGYSVTQAVPGPIFTFAAYLGAVDGGIWGALLATIAIFLPAALLMVSGLYFWARWQENDRLRAAFNAINAAVVGLLAAALWSPVIQHGVASIAAGIIAALCYVGIRFVKLPPWLIAAFGALAGAFVL